MNRRRFTSALVGAGTVLFAGVALPSTAAFASTATPDAGKDQKPARSSSDDAGEEILQHVVASWQRTYECEKPVTYVTAVAVELDKKRNASDAYDYMREGGVDSFDEFELDDEGDFGDLTDQAYLYNGVSGSGASAVNVALLYVQQGTMVYAIVAAGEGDQAEVVGEFYDTLFDDKRKETDALLTEDEMPRGFTMTEDSSGDTSDTSDDRGRDDSDTSDDTSDDSRDDSSDDDTSDDGKKKKKKRR